jgi:hypothetical protein
MQPYWAAHYGVFVMKSPLFRRILSLVLLCAIGGAVTGCVVEPAPGYYYHPHAYGYYGGYYR